MNPAELTFAPHARSPRPRRSPRSALRTLARDGGLLRSQAASTRSRSTPYLTRAGSLLAQCLVAPLRPNEALLARHLPRADAIVLGHTHFDHALDAPSIAKRTGAVVLGSRSAAKLCLGQGVPPTQVEVVERGAGSEPVVREVGPFRLVFHASAHSPFVLGRVLFEGEIADCDDIPMRMTDYRCGAVFGVEVRVAGKTLSHVGSAEISVGHAEARGRPLRCCVLLAGTPPPGSPSG